MAQLTPLAKGLITVIILGGAATLAWNFGLKDWVQSRSQTSKNDTNLGGAALGKSTNAQQGSSDSSAIGSAQNPLKVSLVSFHGYAPALVANGNSLKTQENSIYAQKGANIEFLIQDDIPTLSTLFEGNIAHCAWRTSDFWAQEQPNLRNSGLDGKAVVIVDNTQGGDAVIARDPAIRSIEDLPNRKIALLQFTPSHGMLIDAVENSSLNARGKQNIKTVFINAEEGTGGVRAAFESGNVDAAVLWDPDLSLALRNTPGAHVVYSTKTASNLIYDVMVCNSQVLNRPDGREAIQKFVAGWLEGVDVAKQNPDKAVDALVATEEFFKLLADKEGRPFVKSLFKNLVWTNLADNARILGLVGGTNHYERVYTRFDQIYREAGALANPKSPVISAQNSFDYSFVETLLKQHQGAEQAAHLPTNTFSDAQRDAAVQNPAVVTKPIDVNFASGSGALNKRAQEIIDKQMVPMIENNGSAYFEVSGNTDSVGSSAANKRLSEQRAQAVVDYLVKEWSFSRSRFKVIGNGSDKPLCSENNPDGYGGLESCREANRTTRLAVFGNESQ